MGSVSSGSAAPARMLVPCSNTSPELTSNTRGVEYDFRSHPRVAQCLQLFAVVELVEVRCFVFQTSVVAAPPLSNKKDAGEADKRNKPFKPRHIRFGIAPRAIATEFQAGTNNTPGVTGSNAVGVVNIIPNLRSLTTSSMTAAQASITWSAKPGPGDVAFPPGVQLDFRSVETRFSYARFFIGCTNIAKQSFPLCKVQLDFTVTCSGANFGAVY